MARMVPEHSAAEFLPGKLTLPLLREAAAVCRSSAGANRSPAQRKERTAARFPTATGNATPQLRGQQALIPAS